ncbi:60S ribosomal protein L3 [Basidiobolus ranarum]|uniref:60S ribosomal protein L3 n=1 Tax=Basidiobolus ranarum TaxID=34480 RepID=A0ABR2X4E6_9FUNG
MIYRISNGPEKNTFTEYDLTYKAITLMGGFPNYRNIREDIPMVNVNTKISTLEKSLEFIDTSSKFGHGRFHTVEEKKVSMNTLMKGLST